MCSYYFNHRGNSSVLNTTRENHLLLPFLLLPFFLLFLLSLLFFSPPLFLFTPSSISSFPSSFLINSPYVISSFSSPSSSFLLLFLISSSSSFSDLLETRIKFFKNGILEDYVQNYQTSRHNCVVHSCNRCEDAITHRGASMSIMAPESPQLLPLSLCCPED